MGDLFYELSEKWVRMTNVPGTTGTVTVHAHSDRNGLFNETGFFPVKQDPTTGVSRCTQCADIAPTEVEDEEVYDYDQIDPSEFIDDDEVDDMLDELDRERNRRDDDW